MKKFNAKELLSKEEMKQVQGSGYCNYICYVGDDGSGQGTIIQINCQKHWGTGLCTCTTPFTTRPC